MEFNRTLSTFGGCNNNWSCTWTLPSPPHTLNCILQQLTSCYSDQAPLIKPHRPRHVFQIQNNWFNQYESLSQPSGWFRVGEWSQILSDEWPPGIQEPDKWWHSKKKKKKPQDPQLRGMGYYYSHWVLGRPCHLMCHSSFWLACVIDQNCILWCRVKCCSARKGLTSSADPPTHTPPLLLVNSRLVGLHHLHVSWFVCHAFFSFQSIYRSSIM